MSECVFVSVCLYAFQYFFGTSQPENVTACGSEWVNESLTHKPSDKLLQ